MFSQTIPLIDLVTDFNENKSQRLKHILQKACDYVVNQKLDPNEVQITINVSKVYEGKQIRYLTVGSGI